MSSTCVLCSEEIVTGQPYVTGPSGWTAHFGCVVNAAAEQHAQPRGTGSGAPYPPPGVNTDCRCTPNLVAAMFCPTGHMTECHYPLNCAAAECSHLPKYADSETGGGT